MSILLWLLLSIGLAPLLIGAALLNPSPSVYLHRPRADIGSVLLLALAFNLTYFWQELWLVIPKALTPGVHPILYHNDHAWTGSAPIVELLQGSGALATAASGTLFLATLALWHRAAATWRLFLFWMAFQGVNQSLTQLAIGTMVPGNDVGRTLAYLHMSAGAKWVVFAIAIAGLGAAGNTLARAWPRVQQDESNHTRALAQEMLLTALLATILIIPFRVPRDLIEVAFVPLFVNLVGVGWLTLGVATARGARNVGFCRIGVLGPAIALGVTLLVFQLILRPGIFF